MLILNRNFDDSILIGNNIKINILSNHLHVTIGIEAPKDIQIICTELLEQIRENKYSPIAKETYSCNHDLFD